MEPRAKLILTWEALTSGKHVFDPVDNFNSLCLGTRLGSAAPMPKV